MARVKSIAARRHRKVRSAARGFKQARQTRIKAAKEALMHAGQYAYSGRKLRKRDLRSLWIVRLNAAAREHDMSYSKLINGLKNAKIELDRKILSDIAITDPEAFKEIISKVK
ncbi:50S ribosomal protein L20 [Candidatus Woesebacteria bacterium RIFCSPLOWO2_01_FULL_44_24b]|nr:MAG: 50S ribosomal protein L20 [Candidatus Woesebacteria bacterium RIFCSPLOWO2_01_FULL_44_24b]